MELEDDKTKSFFNDRYVWLLLIISLSVRIYLSFFTYVIKNDSVAFMQNAKYFASGDFSSALRHDYHPLYSLIMAVLYKVVPNMELSGTIISVLFGTLTVIVFYLIGKNIFDQKVSFVSAIILAFHPYAVRFSADIISESTYFFFFISALGTGFFAITRGRLLLFALSGICSALAYLARPEGIGIIIIVVSCCALKDCTRIKVLWREKLISILILTVSFLVFSMPYLVYIKSETGMWLLTKKRNLSHTKIMRKLDERVRDEVIEEDIDKVDPGIGINKQVVVRKTDTNKRDKNFIHKNSGISKKGPTYIELVKTPIHSLSMKTYITGALFVIKKYLSTFHLLLFMFFVIGVINYTRARRELFFGFYVMTIIAFYLIILYRLNIVNTGSFLYPSRRHLMPIVIPAVFFVGIGVLVVGTWLHIKFHNNSLIVGFKELLRSTWIIQLIVLTIIIGVLLPKTLKPQRFDKLGIKKVGQWIKGNVHKPSPVILSSSARSVYYADGYHIQIDNMSGVLSVAIRHKVDYLLITYKEYKFIEKELLRSVKDKRITLAYKYPEKEPSNRHSVLLYEILY